MAFTDLFRPKWKHSDPAVRRTAVVGLASSDDVMSLDEVRNLLRARGLMVGAATGSQVELLA